MIDSLIKIQIETFFSIKFTKFIKILLYILKTIFVSDIANPLHFTLTYNIKIIFIYV